MKKTVNDNVTYSVAVVIDRKTVTPERTTSGYDKIPEQSVQEEIFRVSIQGVEVDEERVVLCINDFLSSLKPVTLA